MAGQLEYRSKSRSFRSPGPNLQRVELGYCSQVLALLPHTEPRPLGCGRKLPAPTISAIVMVACGNDTCFRFAQSVAAAGVGVTVRISTPRITEPDFMEFDM